MEDSPEPLRKGSLGLKDDLAVLVDLTDGLGSLLGLLLDIVGGDDTDDSGLLSSSVEPDWGRKERRSADSSSSDLEMNSPNTYSSNRWEG